MKTEYKQFTEDMIHNAGRLLAARHTANRVRQSLLPARFEDPTVATKAVDALLDLRTSVIPAMEMPQGMIVRQAGQGDDHH